MQFLGRISMSLYLIHEPIIFYIRLFFYGNNIFDCIYIIWFQLCFQNLSLTIFQEFGIGKIMLEHQNLLFGLYPFTFWFLWYLPLCWQSMSKNQFGRNWKSGSWKSRHCTTWISGRKITLNVLSEYDFYVSLVMELFNYQSLIFFFYCGDN